MTRKEGSKKGRFLLLVLKCLQADSPPLFFLSDLIILLVQLEKRKERGEGRGERGKSLSAEAGPWVQDS